MIISLRLRVLLSTLFVFCESTAQDKKVITKNRFLAVSSSSMSKENDNRTNSTWFKCVLWSRVELTTALSKNTDNVNKNTIRKHFE